MMQPKKPKGGKAGKGKLGIPLPRTTGRRAAPVRSKA